MPLCSHHPWPLGKPLNAMPCALKCTCAASCAHAHAFTRYPCRHTLCAQSRRQPALTLPLSNRAAAPTGFRAEHERRHLGSAAVPKQLTSIRQAGAINTEHVSIWRY